LLTEKPVSHDWSFDTKDVVRRATDIVDLVGRYIQLRRSGRHFVGLCPWHDDSRPSLQVNPDRQSFKCWVCDIGGDVFSFVMKMEGLSFPEALVMLAERAGVTLPQRGGPASSSRDAEIKPLLYRAMAWAAEQYHQFLLHDDKAAVARDYLTRRGITNESITRFQLGFAPEGWTWLLQRSAGTEFTPRILERIGLVAQREGGASYYDRFRGRVLFTIRDAQGRPVALGGRILPELAESSPAKYINSPETPLFSKSHLVYGLDLARDACGRARQVIVMEGYTDAIVAHQCGFTNTVAVLGTALGERHIRLLRRYADQVVLVLDGDEAGRRRTNEVLELFVAHQVDLRVLTLPDELDPCDFLLQRGPEPFADLLSKAVDALEHRLNTLANSPGQLGAHAATAAMEEILAILAKSPRLSSQTASAARLREEQVIHRLGRTFEVPDEVLRARLAALRKGGARGRESSLAPEQREGVHAMLDAWERELLELILQDPSLVEHVLQALGPDQFSSAVCRQIMLVCRDLIENLGEVDFAHLLSHFDEPEIKSLLVDLDERGRAKGAGSIPERLELVLESFRRRREESRRRERLAALRQRQVDEEEGVKFLLEAIQQGRSRHCISESTDG
jgi:DNA primase